MDVDGVFRAVVGSAKVVEADNYEASELVGMFSLFYNLQRILFILKC